MGVDRLKYVGWTHTTSAASEPITCVWGAPSVVQGHSPCSGGRRKQSPLKLKLFCLLDAQLKQPHFLYFANSLNPGYL